MIILLEVHLLSIFIVPILGFGFKINPHFDRIQYKSTDNVFKAKPGRITLFERQELNKSPATFLFTTSEDVEASLADPSSMRVKEITQELKERSAEYSDCFDKNSLVKRLKEARDGTISPKTPPKQETEEAAPNEKGTQTETQEISRESSINMDASDEIEDSKKAFDKVSVKEELRQMRVAELRTKLGERGIRWSNMIEKEDLVRALSSDMETAANFSASGLLSPSKVTDVDETTLALELDNEANTPLILDVYATWCGPCQLMVPQFSAAAEQLGSKVRFAKIDSDKYPNMSSKLKVGGLPTIIVFGKDGREVTRQEGALMKDRIINLVTPFTS